MIEIYVSTDVESDGPIPGPHSMLSFASAAYLADKTLISTFSANLELLPNASADPNTMEWWHEHPEAWERCRTNLHNPGSAMQDYTVWLNRLPGIPVFVAYPLAYDFMFVYWYLMRFVGHSPFSHHGIDIRTYAMALEKKGYKECSKDSMPKRWLDEIPHRHEALDDAIEQGALFCNMLIANTRVGGTPRDPEEFAERVHASVDHAIRAHSQYAKSRKHSIRYWDKATPYFIHPIWCAMTLLTETTLSENIRYKGYQALLWHDTLEDTELPLPQDADEQVIELVEEMTFADFNDERENLWARSDLTKLLKLYDKVSNLLDGTWMDDKRRKAMVAHTLKLVQFASEKFGELNIVKMARAICRSP